MSCEGSRDLSLLFFFLPLREVLSTAGHRPNSSLRAWKGTPMMAVHDPSAWYQGSMGLSTISRSERMLYPLVVWAHPRQMTLPDGTILFSWKFLEVVLEGLQ